VSSSTASSRRAASFHQYTITGLIILLVYAHAGRDDHGTAPGGSSPVRARGLGRREPASSSLAVGTFGTGVPVRPCGRQSLQVWIPLTPSNRHGLMSIMTRQSLSARSYAEFEFWLRHKGGRHHRVHPPSRPRCLAGLRRTAPLRQLVEHGASLPHGWIAVLAAVPPCSSP